MNASINMFAGWAGFVAGAASGAGLGLFFHRDGWLGGYGTWRRRLLRLGHIACFGLGMLNVLFALSVRVYPISTDLERWASTAWLIALVAMPMCCALAAWRASWRHLFPVPVGATCIGIGCVLCGWWLNLVGAR